MVEKIVENQVLFYFAGITVILGALIKVIVGISLKRLVKAASNMSKSNHALMRLVRAKFEHACMVSDKVQNVPAFAEKYLYEYKVLGMRLISLRQMEKTMIWLCGISSVVGGILTYYNTYDQDAVQSYAVIGGAGVIFLTLLQVTAPEKQRLQAVKMYMVDFLENTYAHRYEKIPRQMQEQVIDGETVDEPIREPRRQPVREPVYEPEIHPVDPPKKPVLPTADPELQPVQAAKIREILEEFLT